MTSTTWLAIAILWVVPIFVARSIGEPKHRAGWMWGLFLGWLGVIAVYMLPPLPAEREKCAHCGMENLPGESHCRRCARALLGEATKPA